MAQPWNNWFHCTCNTFGVWLPGDPRGWHTRHHRQDTAASPTDTMPRFSRLPARPIVHLPVQLRQQVAGQFVERLLQEGIEVIIVSLDDHHLHALARIRDHQCRHWLGIAKKHSSLWLGQNGYTFPGGIWGKGSRSQPIASRQHQLNVYRYILAHRERGASIWKSPTERQSRI